MSYPHREDARLPILQALHTQLREATMLWSQQRAFDPRVVEASRRAAILLNHQRYLELIPAYRRFAEEQGLLRVEEIDTITNELMFTDDLFKSYDSRWLDSRDYGRMTDWLGTVFTRPPRVDIAGVQSISEWRARLREDEIYLTYSSGTSGHISFIPRDRTTLQALSNNGNSYLRVLRDGPQLTMADFDCLVLGFRGVGMGVQSAGTGLARLSSRSRFLYDVEMNADIARSVYTKPAIPEEHGGALRFLEVTRDKKDAAYEGSFDFLRQAQADRRPVLIFGTPFQINEACCRILNDAGSLPLPPRSMLISGGGWKSFEGERLPQDELLQRIENAFDIPRSHIIDTYSTSEMNCVFMSCHESRYHIPPLIEPVIVDDLLIRLVGDDVFGTFGFLDPFAVSYPGFIITSDQARLMWGDCSCGLSGWSLVGEIQRAPSHEVRGCGGVMASVMT